MIKRLVTTGISFGILLLPAVAFADLNVGDVQDVMTRLQKVLNPFFALLVMISYICGIFFVLKGMLMLKQFAMPITQASKPGEVAGPLVQILVGAVLLYIPSTTDVVSTTLFGTGVGSGGLSIFSGQGLQGMGVASDAIMGYAPVSVEGQWASMVDTIVLFMEFIGFIAFLRGWFIIAHAGQPGGQPGSISKGIIHIVGGVLAINFLPLVNIVTNTISGAS